MLHTSYQCHRLIGSGEDLESIFDDIWACWSCLSCDLRLFEQIFVPTAPGDYTKFGTVAFEDHTLTVLGQRPNDDLDLDLLY